MPEQKQQRQQGSDDGNIVIIEQPAIFKFPGDEEWLLAMEQVESYTEEERRRILCDYVERAEENALQLIVARAQNVTYDQLLQLDDTRAQVFMQRLLDIKPVSSDKQGKKTD